MAFKCSNVKFEDFKLSSQILIHHVRKMQRFKGYLLCSTMCYKHVAVHTYSTPIAILRDFTYIIIKLMNRNFLTLKK